MRTMLVLVLSLAATSHAIRGSAGTSREQSLLQVYDQQLSGTSTNSKSQITPVNRVVNLLKEMQKTLNQEMEEDESLYDKLACWCNNNKYEKKGSSDAASGKISDLEATIEMLTAKSSELKTKIAELEAEVAADKTTLAEATALRKKELAEFHEMELANIAAIENLKSAIVVLSKHQDAAFPQMPLSFLQEQDPWAAEHESHLTHSFDEFLRRSKFDLSAHPQSSHAFLQDKPDVVAAPAGWSADEVTTLKKAIKTASAFLQQRDGHGYMPSYSAQSGEIFGVLKQMKAEMETDLSEAQKTEASRAANFAELRAAKTTEIEDGEKMAETKEDEKATTDNDLAEAKEDLGQTQGQLEGDQKFMANLEKTCAEADANFALRKKSRLEEIKAVSETMEILTGDDAKDAMDTTFSFVQTSRTSAKRRAAASILRRSAKTTRNPELSLLASSVELDAFTKVKEEIDKMVATLKKQQADEVKKNDWCKSELQENEMATMKTKDLKADLDAKSEQLTVTIKTLSEEIEKAHLDISNLQVALQRASENRKQENIDFQKVVADQTVTAEILAKALDKLATFYDEAAFAQTRKHAQKQTPPVPQMEYKKSSGASGVMSMIEKLIYDTKDITAESKKSEGEAQAAYEALVADTNDSVGDLTKAITSKTKAKAQAKKDLSSTDSDLADAIKELENLGKTNADLHGDCDYYMKNFAIRQKSRAEEIEALQQAKQILNGANLS